MFQQKVNKIVTEGYDINISETISSAYNLVVKKILAWSVLFMLMYLALSFLIQFLAYTIAGIKKLYHSVARISMGHTKGTLKCTIYP